MNETYDTNTVVNDPENYCVLCFMRPHIDTSLSLKPASSESWWSDQWIEWILLLKDHLIQWGEAGQSSEELDNEWLCCQSDYACCVCFQRPSMQCAPVPSTPLCNRSQWKTGDHKKASNTAGIAYAKALDIWILNEHSKQNWSSFSSAHIHLQNSHHLLTLEVNISNEHNPTFL